jgi:hypothetical protein
MPAVWRGARRADQLQRDGVIDGNDLGDGGSARGVDGSEAGALVGEKLHHLADFGLGRRLQAHPFYNSPALVI